MASWRARRSLSEDIPRIRNVSPLSWIGRYLRRSGRALIWRRDPVKTTRWRYSYPEPGSASGKGQRQRTSEYSAKLTANIAHLRDSAVAPDCKQDDVWRSWCCRWLSRRGDGRPATARRLSPTNLSTAPGVSGCHTGTLSGCQLPFMLAIVNNSRYKWLTPACYWQLGDSNALRPSARDS